MPEPLYDLNIIYDDGSDYGGTPSSMTKMLLWQFVNSTETLGLWFRQWYRTGIDLGNCLDRLPLLVVLPDLAWLDHGLRTFFKTRFSLIEMFSITILCCIPILFIPTNPMPFVAILVAFTFCGLSGLFIYCVAQNTRTRWSRSQNIKLENAG